MSARKPQQRFNEYMQYSTIGFQMMGAILICAWLGNWIDGKIGANKPYVTIFGMLFGVTAAIITMIRSVKKLQQKEAEAKKKKGDG